MQDEENQQVQQKRFDKRYLPIKRNIKLLPTGGEFL